MIVKLVNSFLFLLVVLSFSVSANDEFISKIKPFMEKYCIDCHDDETQKGGVALHDLNKFTYANAGLWQRIWEQVSLKEMPPRKKKKQPALMERYELSQVITSGLIKAHMGKGDYTSHMHPLKGNHLDHDLIFNTSHKNLEPASSPVRVWRVHPMEHIVRLNELVSKEPAFNPKLPGLYARGDRFAPIVPHNDFKVHFGLERMISVRVNLDSFSRLSQGFYPVLSEPKTHGLRDYPYMHKMNGPIATQMLGMAEDILNFMAYGPKTVLHGTTTQKNKGKQKVGIVYGDEIKRPLTPVYELMKKPGVSDARLLETINFLFEAITLRKPTKEDSNFYLGIVKDSIQKLGKEKGVIPGLATIFVNHHAFFRSELAEYGTPDKHGRIMLQGQELLLAINHAFSYIMPDDKLSKALAAGKLKTREDVKREVTRILNDDYTRKPRILQFFREYFDYGHAADIDKDPNTLTGIHYRTPNKMVRKPPYMVAMVNLIAHTDRLVELILEEDKDVFKELLTTDRAIISDLNETFYRNIDSGKPIIPAYNFYGKKNVGLVKTKDGKDFGPGGRKKTGPKYDAERKAFNARRYEMMSDIFPGEKTPIQVRFSKLYRFLDPKNIRATKIELGATIEPRTLTRVNKKQRMGILTQPSWLISHSDAMDNHAIWRGKWVRERLLGDAIPDVPIGVNAMLPEEPKATLRHRMRVTREDECWRCHKKIDPLGMAFEMFNHLGQYREKEKKKPVDSSGEIIYSGDPTLDGPVSNAIDMIQKLAKSERVEQVFIRHVFRYWMGRNETLNDAPILKEAHKVYKESGGSMKALLTSLLTSDAFLYRKIR